MILSDLLGWIGKVQIGAIHMVINHMIMLRASQLRVVSIECLSLVTGRFRTRCGMISSMWVALCLVFAIR